MSFTIGAGEICALLGRTGAGKTTMRMLVALARCDSGSARLLDRLVALASGVLARVGVLIDGPGSCPTSASARR